MSPDEVDGPRSPRRPPRPSRPGAPDARAGGASAEPTPAPAPRRPPPRPARPVPADAPAPAPAGGARRRPPARPPVVDGSVAPSGPASRVVTFDEAVPTAASAAASPEAKSHTRGPARRPARPEVEPALPGDEPRETYTGRLRRIRAERPKVADLVEAEPDHASAFRRRYGIPYDTQGPKVRTGVLWAIAVAGVAAPQFLRPWGLAVLYGVVAAVASAQLVDAARGDRDGLDRVVAGLGGSALAVAATLGAQALGGAYLVLVVVALASTVATPERARLPIPRAGSIVLAAGVTGGAAASLVLLADYEIGALVILLVFVMVYDASDFGVGSGASNGIEGPVAGMLMIAAFTTLFAVAKVPPFRGADIWTFSVLTMVSLPAGQILASALLPQADHHAPAVRRIDSLLVVAPAWAGLVGLYMANAV